MNGRSIDAMGTQEAIAGQIIDQQADYVMALKENQPTLLEEVKHAFDTMPLDFSAEKVDADHGRVEQRKCEVIQDLRFVDEAANWPALNSIVRLTSSRTRKTDGQQSTQVRYFISSLTQGEAIAQAIRRTGTLKIACTGSWTCNSARTTSVNGSVTPRRILPSLLRLL